MKKLIVLLFIAASGGICCNSKSSDCWTSTLHKQLGLMGHRNWILIADSAYPLQNKPGIKTVMAEGTQIDTIKKALAEIKNCNHIRPIFYCDKEMAFVSEQYAPGIDAYRASLKTVMENTPVNTLPHEQLIGRLDQAAEMYLVLVIKTKSILPYTSLFIELNCGYWSDEAEKDLRSRIK